MLKKSTLMRVFFGLPFPKEKARAYRELIIDKNPKITHRVRWIKEGKHHITVRFLGNVAKQKVPLIVDKVKQSIQGTKPFKVILRNHTADPGPDAHIVEANVQPSLELNTLYDSLDFAIASANLPPEKRVYRPHITIFRPCNGTTIQFKSIPLSNELVEVKQLVLYQSVPGDQGNTYIPLNIFPFEE